MAGTETEPAKPGGVLRARLRRTAPAPAAPAPAPVPPAPAPSVERIAATAAARALRRAGRLPATAEAVASQGISLTELPELLPERALIAVIEAGGDRLGVVALCPTLLASLIEVQAIGHLTARAVAPRRPTRADAALAADFVNTLLQELGETLAGLPGHAALAGYRYASYLDDPRPLELMLDDAGFRAIRVDLRLGAGGERRGTLLVSVPATPEGEAPATAAGAAGPVAAIPGSAVPTPKARDDEAPATLAAAIRAAPVPLVAVLCRRRISLRDLRSLKPGATIALPRAAVDDAWLETQRGQKLARGKLGEIDGFHALRLRHGDAPGTANADATPADRPATSGPPFDVHLLSSARPGGALAGAVGASPAAAEPPISDLAAPDVFRVPMGGGEAAVLPLQQT